MSWNDGTSINILSTTHQEKAPQGKIVKTFLLDALKTAFQIQKRHLTQRWVQSGFFPKIRTLFFQFPKTGTQGLAPLMFKTAYQKSYFPVSHINFSKVFAKKSTMVKLSNTWTSDPANIWIKAKESSHEDHLLVCNDTPSHDGFSVLAHNDNKHWLVMN